MVCQLAVGLHCVATTYGTAEYEMLVASSEYALLLKYKLQYWENITVQVNAFIGISSTELVRLIRISVIL